MKLVLAVALAVGLFALVPLADAYPPVCIEKSAGTDLTGSVEVWVTCYPGVWRCEPGQQMPECDRLLP